MGRTPKPLRILVDPDIASWGEFAALREQGHTIVSGTEPSHSGGPDWNDLVLGPTCWHMTPKHRKYLPLAIAAARKQRYPKET